MVRTYVRKSNRGSAYNQETLQMAIELVKTGQLTIYRASKTYNIPKNTLADHVKGRRGQKSNSYGRPTDIRLQEETVLADGIRTMEKWGFGLSRREVLNVVADYVRCNNIKTQFKNGVPGEDWFLNFKRRHKLSIKTPQTVEYARKKCFDPFVIYEYFDLLEKTLQDLKLENKPCQIWNLDESSFCSDPSKTKIVGQRGIPATRTTSGPGKDNTTVVMCCSASGAKAPPLIIFKGKNMWDQWLAPAGTEYPRTMYAATKKGWMESTVFKNYFQKCILTSIGEERPVLIIYDGHTTHVGLDVIQIAKNNDVTILKLPPHTSHLLQPLDLSVFKSLKSRWDAKLVEWQRRNVGTKIPKSIFSKLIGEIWTETTPELLASGFVKAGICPFQKNVIPKDRFDPQALKRWESSKAEGFLPVEPVAATVDVETFAENNTFNQGGNCSKISDDVPQILNMPSTPVANTQTYKTSFEELLLQSTKRDKPLGQQKRKRVCTGAEVITQKEVEQIIMEENITNKPQASKKQLKSSSKRKVQKSKKTEISSSDESDTETWKSDESENCFSEFNDSEDDDLENIMNPNEHQNKSVEPKQSENNKQNDVNLLDIHEGDFVLAKFPGKKKIYTYVCCITEIICDEEAEVTCLRKLKNPFEFRLKESDTCSIMLCEILEKLETPKIVKVGKYDKYVFSKAVNVCEL